MQKAEQSPLTLPHPLGIMNVQNLMELHPVPLGILIWAGFKVTWFVYLKTHQENPC